MLPYSGPFSHSFSVWVDTTDLTVEKQKVFYFSRFSNLRTFNKHRYVNSMSSNGIIFYLTLPICKKNNELQILLFPFRNEIKLLSSNFKYINQFNSFNIRANKWNKSKLVVKHFTLIKSFKTLLKLSKCLKIFNLFTPSIKVLSFLLIFYTKRCVINNIVINKLVFRGQWCIFRTILRFYRKVFNISNNVGRI